MSFYLHTGNAFSSLEAPFNTPSHFITNLPKILDFNQEWEAGLVEVLFQKSHLDSKTSEKNTANSEPSEKTELKAATSEKNNTSEKTTPELKTSESDGVNVDQEKSKKATVDLKTSEKSSIDQKTSVVYICGDFIDHSIVGDKTLPFFRSFSLVSGKKLLNRTYAKPFYVKLNTKFIQNLSIWLVNEKGGKVQTSETDNIFLTFHFRKRNGSDCSSF